MKNVTYISAGAGSGKTHKLTDILKKKLSESKEKTDSPVDPSQVILTTFTELAAAEFREKAREALLSQGNVAAASQLDNAAIGTVHSVAFGFIRRFWYLLGYGADIQPLSERDQDFYMRESLSRIVNENDAQGNVRYRQDLDNFRTFRNYYDIVDSNNKPDELFWQQILKDMVEKMEYYSVDDVSKSIEKSIDTLKAVYCKGPVDYVFLEKGLREYRDFCAGKMKKEDDPGDYGNREGTRLLSVREKGWQWVMEVKAMMKRKCCESTASKTLEYFTGFLAALEESDVSSSHLEILEPFVRSVFSLAKVWRDDYQAYKERNHIISYNDMERLFLNLLTNEEEVRRYVRDRYRLVMVDEFQDSNPIQLRIFNILSELVSEGGGHSYWVGDPKQAIYGFRGADSDLITSVSKRFRFYDDAEIHSEEGEDQLGTGRLVESWRSRKVLVDLVNYVFRDKFDGEIDEHCITLDAHFTDDDLTSEPVCHLNYVTDNNRAEKPDPRAIASKVREMLSSGMMVHSGRRDEDATVIRPKDIAVLCRLKNTVKDVVKALREQEIPVSQSESDLMQRIEVVLVVTLLQYMQNPQDSHAKADLMRLLWGGNTGDILKDRISYVKENTDETTGEIIEDVWRDDDENVIRLKGVTDGLRNLSIPEIVRGLIYGCDLPLLCDRWGDGNVRRQNLSTVQHLADDYDAMCLQMGLGASVSGFINYLNTVEPEPEKDNMSDTVKVFTYHGSKGLEWPVVIMNELGYDALDQSDIIKKSFMKVNEVVLKDNSSPRNPFAKDYYLNYFPYTIKGAQTKPSQPMMDAIGALDLYRMMSDRLAKEEKRLLYVGMTRAKDCLYTVGLKDDFTMLTNVGIRNPSRNNVWDVPDKAAVCIDISSPEKAGRNGESTFSMVIKPKTRTEYEARYLSPSKLESFDGYTSHTAWTQKGTEMDHKGWGKDYAAIGSCIHDIFAVFSPSDDRANRRHALNIIGGYGLADRLAGHTDAIINSARWLYDRLQEAFPQKEGDITEREYPFMQTLPSGQVLRGEMDLLWRYSDDRGRHCVLVDYKTFPGVTLHEHTQKHYAQLSAYAQAMKDAGEDITHALIYYPVHGTIHELNR